MSGITARIEQMADMVGNQAKTAGGECNVGDLDSPSFEVEETRAI